jgi:hypothetical protein
LGLCDQFQGVALLSRGPELLRCVLQGVLFFLIIDREILLQKPGRPDLKFTDGGRIRAIRQQFADGLLFDWMQQVRDYFGKRLKNESAFRHARMRNNQIWFADYPIAVKQNIKIQRTRRVGESPDTAAVAFDFIAPGQQFMGRQRCFQFKYLIQKPGLIGIPHRFGFKKGRHPENPPTLAETARAEIKAGFAVADI